MLAELYLGGATSTVRCVGLRYTVGGLLDDELVGAFVLLEAGGLLLTGREVDGLGADFGAGFGAGLGGGFGAVRVGVLGFFAGDTVGGRDVRAGVDGLAVALLGADLVAGGGGLDGLGAGLGAALGADLGAGFDTFGGGFCCFGAAAFDPLSSARDISENIAITNIATTMSLVILTIFFLLSLTGLGIVCQNLLSAQPARLSTQSQSAQNISIIANARGLFPCQNH